MRTVLNRLKFIAFVFSFTVSTCFCQLTWVPQSSGTSDNIESLDFVNANTGWTVSGVNGTSRTTNGGTTWVYSGIPGGQNMFGVDFVNASQGWAVDNLSTVYYTGNGGATWLPQYSNSLTTNYALEIFFLNNQYGWVARQGDVLYTDDGGSTWDSSFYATSWPPYDVEFVTPDVGYIMGLSGSIAKSTDGGNTWVEKTVDVSGLYYGSFDVVNASTIYVVGQMGLIFFSSDGGDTWVQQTSGVSSYTLLDVHFFDLNHGVIVGEYGTILTTTDGGVNWIPNVSGTGVDLRGVEMVSQTTIYAVGYNGVILKSEAIPNDLVIDIYLGSDLVCDGNIIDVPVTIKNLQEGELTSGIFVITNSLGDIMLTAPWSGSLIGYELEDIVIGQIPINGSDTYTISFIGDSIVTNNTYGFYVNVYDHSAVGVNEPLPACPGDSVELQATGGEHYQWLSLGPLDTLANVNVAPFIDTYYAVRIDYASICKWYDTVYVSIDNTCNSNNLAFTPNGDGINDYLHIDGAEGFNNTVTIYDRWGSEINFFSNYNNSDIVWLGDDAGGTALNDGTYYYILENGGVLINGEHIEKVGWVQILR